MLERSLSEEWLNNVGRELNFMHLYPKSIGGPEARPQLTEEDRTISRTFGLDYFNGDRKHGYGGLTCPKFLGHGLVESGLT